DVDQGAGVVGAGAVEHEVILDGDAFGGGGDEAAVDLELRVEADRHLRAATQGGGAGDLDDAGAVVERERPGEAAVVAVEDQGAGPLLGQLGPGRPAQLALDVEGGVAADGEELARAAAGGGQHHLHADDVVTHPRADDERAAAGDRGVAEGQLE